MPDRTRAKDASSLHKYRIELPVLIDDMDLSVYARSLYIHLKRVAGDHGSCWESARTLAKACGMSAGQVSKAKDELERHGLIVRNIKSVKGGIGDDITIVDIWPDTFQRYAPESERAKESDHHTITLTSKRSPHDHLDESDHHTITSGESDQEAITLTSKRSPHDPKNHDLPYSESHDGDGDGDGDRARESFFRELRKREISRTKARQIAASDLDPSTVLASIDNLIAAGKSIGHIINLLEDTPPAKGQPYERPTNGRADHAPHRPKRAAAGTHNPERDAEYDAQIAEWERQAAERKRA
jgi:hypothetical protein